MLTDDTLTTSETQQPQARAARTLPTRHLPEKVRKPFILAVGGTLILLGIALVILPGPFTLPLIVAGFAVLSTEFTWAEQALERGRDGARTVGRLLKHPIVVALAVTAVTATIILGVKYGWFAALLTQLPFTQ